MEEKKQMNVYLYVILLTSVAALILSLLYTSFNPRFVANKAAAKRKAILSCIPLELDLTNDASINTLYEKVEMIAINSNGDTMTLDNVNASAEGGAKPYRTLEELDLANEEKKSENNRAYPVYKYSDTDKAYYVVAIRGDGLWDKIWAYIALESDLNTIAGVYFDHKAETPGLGAEIKDSDDFKQQFIGKKVFSMNSVAVAVIKMAPPAGDPHLVKGISGATITSDGVTDMFVDGMVNYDTYFEFLRSQKKS